MIFVVVGVGRDSDFLLHPLCNERVLSTLEWPRICSGRHQLRRRDIPFETVERDWCFRSLLRCQIFRGSLFEPRWLSGKAGSSRGGVSSEKPRGGAGRAGR